MREELLREMEAARTDEEKALPPSDFQFEAIQVSNHNRGTAKAVLGVAVRILVTA